MLNSLILPIAKTVPARHGNALKALRKFSKGLKKGNSFKMCVEKAGLNKCTEKDPDMPISVVELASALSVQYLNEKSISDLCSKFPGNPMLEALKDLKATDDEGCYIMPASEARAYKNTVDAIIIARELSMSAEILQRVKKTIQPVVDKLRAEHTGETVQ
jgi:hypothetical protein